MSMSRLSFPRLLSALPALLLLAALPAAQATTLDGIVMYDVSTVAGGSMAAGGGNTLGDGGTAVNIYLNTGAGFINHGNGTGASISVPMTAGTDAWSWHIDGSGSLGGTYAEIGLFFDGNTTNPAILGVVPLWTPSPLLTAATSTTAYTLGFGNSTGTDSLSFVDGSITVTLTSFSFLSGGTDLVSQYNDAPNGTSDWYGALGLSVTDSGGEPIPEPGMLAATWMVLLAGARMFGARQRL